MSSTINESDCDASCSKLQNDSGVNESGIQSRSRMSCLRNAVKRTNSRCLKEYKFSVMAKAFKPIYKKNPTKFKEQHQQFLDDVIKEVDREMDNVLAVENLPNLMDGLEKIIQETFLSRETKAWRPTEPSKDVQAHLVPLYRKYKNSLELMLNQMERENKQQQTEILHKRKYINKIEDQMQQHLDMFTEAVEVFEELPTEEMGIEEKN
ncbi:polyamine-modulated factor 1-like [Tubulanus polymorphus]|uniref:polyamine-modulated factor 1-like n=1 Tax=Tubulanus polymorphus TaxID=672921 RepID=UPI003DA51D32